MVSGVLRVKKKKIKCYESVSQYVHAIWLAPHFGSTGNYCCLSVFSFLGFFSTKVQGHMRRIILFTAIGQCVNSIIVRVRQWFFSYASRRTVCGAIYSNLIFFYFISITTNPQNHTNITSAIIINCTKCLTGLDAKSHSNIHKHEHKYIRLFERYQKN